MPRTSMQLGLNLGDSYLFLLNDIFFFPFIITERMNSFNHSGSLQYGYQRCIQIYNKIDYYYYYVPQQLYMYCNA